MLGALNGGQDSSASPVFNGEKAEHYIESYKLLKKYIDQSLD